jgi:hypothetical protein
MNDRTLNADVLFFIDEAWQHLGGISAHRATFGAVTKSTLVKSNFLRENNFA